MDINSFPTAINVTLYRYNHIDNRLWTQIRNQLNYVEVDDTSVVVSVGQLKSLIENNYNDLINQIKSTGAEFLHKKVNSAYFLYVMMSEMQNLQLVKLNLSYEKQFSRLVESEGNKLLKFDFKILAVTIRLSDIFELEDLKLLNPILERLEILEEGVPYSRLKMVELLDILDDWISSEIDEELEDPESDPIPLITTLMDMVDMKTENDNPITLLITDY